MAYKNEVTDVKMWIKDTNGIKAMCNIVINNFIAINSIRVVENVDGRLIVAMPSQRFRNGDFKDLAHPTNKAARAIIEEAVLKKYKEMTTLSDEFAEYLFGDEIIS